MGKSKLPKPRPMLRREIKALRAAGYDPAMLADDANIAQTSAEMVEWILDNIYSEVDFDDTPYPECLKLAAETYKITFGEGLEDAETKNS